jgi:hypothetical protein
MLIKSYYTTGIGSLPLVDPVEAGEFTLNAVDIPFWPQLPKRGFKELMIPQYSEGFPFVVLEGDKIWIERVNEAEQAAFYEAVGKGSDLPMSEQYAAGLFAFIDLLKTMNKKLQTVKGHVTGPVTFTLGLTDKNRLPVYFDEELRELALELLKGKVRWQIGQLKPYANEVVIFVDEPVMSALGTSTYVGVDNNEVIRLLRTVVDEIHTRGAIAGIHCCSKADWGLVIESGVDILNFDAFDYAESIHLYPEQIRQFLERGGILAWGIVPSTEQVRWVNVDSLKSRLEGEIANLQRMGISGEVLWNQCMLTPSCGTGSMEREDSAKVFTLLKELRSAYLE